MNAPSASRTLSTLKRKLESMELEHLRQHAIELHEQLEQAQAEVAQANESANFWQRDAMNMQEAMLDPEYANARCIGLTKSGELLVVKHDA